MTTIPDESWRYAIDAIGLFMSENPDSIGNPFESITINNVDINHFNIKVKFSKEYHIGDLEYFHNTKVTNE